MMSCSGGLYRILKKRLVSKKCYLSKVTFIVFSSGYSPRTPRDKLSFSLFPRASSPQPFFSGDWLSACQKCDIGCGRANRTATMKSFHPRKHPFDKFLFALNHFYRNLRGLVPLYYSPPCRLTPTSWRIMAARSAFCRAASYRSALNGIRSDRKPLARHNEPKLSVPMS